MKPDKIGESIEQLRLGDLRILNAESSLVSETLVTKRSQDLTLINTYLAEISEKYDEGDSRNSSMFYAQALSLFCREYWKPGLVYTEPIKVGSHIEDGVGSFDVRAQLVMHTDKEGLPSQEYIKPNQRYDILVSLGLSSKAFIDIQSVVWGQGAIETTPDFIDWAKLMLESAKNPENAPAMYHPAMIYRVDESNSEGLSQIWLPRISPIEDPRHMLQFLEEQKIAVT